MSERVNAFWHSHMNHGDNPNTNSGDTNTIKENIKNSTQSNETKSKLFQLSSITNKLYRFTKKS